MAYYDLPLSELQVYQPERHEPADFNTFWQDTLHHARQSQSQAVFTPVDTGLVTLEAFDVTFAGFDGQPIKGWFLHPRGTTHPLPCIVEYIGYGGGRGFPTDWLFWPSLGYAYFVMDTRGQGSAWRHGDTPDFSPEADNPQYPGFMTRGILDPAKYYYRRLITDAVRAIDAALQSPRVDPDFIAVTGGSQGGGLTLAVAGLDHRIQAAMPDVPFLCNFRRATHMTDTMPYYEISKYCQVHRDKIDQVFATLEYFDGMNFATRANAPALFSVALMDDICPPSTVFSAYNYYAGKKSINIYDYNNHEGGGTFQEMEKVKFLKSVQPQS